MKALAIAKGLSVRGEPVADESQTSAAVLARLALQKEVIDGSEFKIFEELRVLRNQAAHATNYEPSSADAWTYVSLAGRLAFRLREQAAKSQ